MPLSLTLTAIVDGQSADAADVLVPFNQVQTFVNTQETALTNEIAARAAADTNLKDGVTPFTQINLAAQGSALTITSDAISITQSRHLIDTQGGAATDELKTISGFVTGDILILQIVSAARTVLIKHNTDNIFNYTQADILLDHPSKIYLAVYDAVTAKWCQATAAQQALLLYNTSTPNTKTSVPALGVPDRTLVTTGLSAPRLDYAPGIMSTRRIAIVGSGATIQADLIAAPTLSGTGAAAHQADTTYTSCISGAVAGNAGGWSTTFDITQRRHDPYIDMWIQMPTTLTTARWFFGFWSSAPTNLADPLGSAIGFRYSSADGDTGFRALLDDGAALTLSTNLNTVTADTPYRLRIRVDGSGGGIAYFSIDGGAELAMSTGMPGSSTNLGLLCLVYTNVAFTRSILFSRADAGWK